MVSEESYTTFNPMLAEVVGASIFPEHAVAPLRQVVRQGPRVRFIMGRVSAIDLARRAITCATLGGEAILPYDQLVLAFGNLARTDFIPGLVERALPLKTVGDAIEIRNAVLRRLARIELETDRALRAAIGHFVVIGGGFSGVEVAGELVDCLRSVRRYYPRVESDELKVTLVQDLDALLPELPLKLGEAALSSLRRRGVEVRLGARAVRANDEGLELKDGTCLSTRSVITTAGVRPNPLAAQSGLPLERGRIVVNPDMSVPGAPGVWALGDCARVENALEASVCPPTAQFAVRQGRRLADNIALIAAGFAAKPFRYRARGMMATVGHLNGVAQVLGLSFSGLPAWLLWRAYYLSQTPTLGRKLRIFVEWSWGMFFSTDITHFRFTRSSERP
jgi:NADH dehydrogenase